MAPQPRPGILDIAPYVGGEAHAPGVAQPIRLASNEGALGPSPRAMEAYKALAGELHRYPDGGATLLRDAIGRRYGLDPARIVCGAGSDELIALLVRAYAGPGDEVLYSRHGFLMYAICAKSVGAVPVTAPETGLKADVDQLLAHVSERTKVVFLANPNNPTGSYLTQEEVARLRAGLPKHVILAVDAAYAEYVRRNDYSAGIELVDAADNTVMLRTFSKAYALSALRLGWAYCPPGIADVLNRVRGPFNVAQAAQVAGIAAMEDIAHTEAQVELNEAVRPWFAAEVEALGLKVWPSVANFVLIDFGDRDAESARLFLKENGVLIRQMGGYGLPHCLRATIGTRAEMEAVLNGLRAWIETRR